VDEYTTEMICGGVRSTTIGERDFYIKVEKRNWREKKRKILRVLMEKGRKRPPAAFKLGGWVRGTFPERSRNVLLAINR